MISAGSNTKFRNRLAQPMYDVFEPGLIQDSLNQSNKSTNLGLLIFGKDHWKKLGGEVPQYDDPLTKMFLGRGD